MNDSHRLAELVELARGVERAPERMESGWQRLQASLGAPSPVPNPELTSGAKLALTAGGRWMGALMLGALGLVGAAGWFAHGYRGHVPPAAVGGGASAPAAVSLRELPVSAMNPGEAVATPVASPRSTSPELEPAITTRSAEISEKQPSPSAGSPATPKTTASSGVGFEHELRLIKAARDRLEQGQANQASALLTEHARTFPRGVFADEREALRLQLACKQAPAAHRSQLAAAFERRYPQSPYMHRIRHACQGNGEGGSGSR